MQNYNELEEILKNKNLTRERKVEAINNYFNDYRASVDKELNDYLFKQYAGAALEIGSAAIPMGGASTIGRKLGAKALEKAVGKTLTKDIAETGIGAALGKNVLQKNLGNKLSQEIGSGAFAGMNANAIFGLGRGLMEGSNPIKTAIEDASIGFLTGAVGGAAVGNAERYIKGRQLQKFGDIDNLDKTLRNKYFDNAKKFYKDYNQGKRVNDFEFSRRGLQETLRWNPKQAQNFPNLVKDIKNSKRLPDAPNIKTEDKLNVSHYELYQGENGLHHIEVLKEGKKRFYITKDTLASPPQATSQGANKSINNMINDFPPIFNPAQVAINNPTINNNLQKVTPNEIIRTTSTGRIGSPINSINNLSQNFNPAQVAINNQQNTTPLYNKFPQITKDTLAGTPQATSQGSNKSINNMINDFPPNFNPAQVAIPSITAGATSGLTSDHAPFQLRIANTVWDTIPMANPLKQENHIFTPQEIGNMTTEEFTKNEATIMKQAKDGIIKPQSKQQNYAGYRNAVNGSNQIFSREDIGAMSRDEFDNNQKAIWSQLNSIGIPTNKSLEHSTQNGGGTVFVKPYKRRDGTEVKGYYRSL